MVFKNSKLQLEWETLVYLWLATQSASHSAAFVLFHVHRSDCQSVTPGAYAAVKASIAAFS